MDILTAMTDENDVIFAIDECRFNVNNGGHEWYTRAYDCQLRRMGRGGRGQLPPPLNSGSLST